MNIGFSNKMEPAKKTIAFLEENEIEFIPNWPANSPDLSPIEMVWGMIKAILKTIKGKEKISRDTYANLIVNLWREVP